MNYVGALLNLMFVIIMFHKTGQAFKEGKDGWAALFAFCCALNSITLFDLALNFIRGIR